VLLTRSNQQQINIIILKNTNKKGKIFIQLKSFMTRDIPNPNHTFLKKNGLQQFMIREPFLFEEWVQICTFLPEVKEYYWISNHGKVLNTKSIPFVHMNINLDNRGYEQISLSTNNGGKTFKVHRLVGIAFNYIDNYEELTVNHLDANKRDNYSYNLQWATNYENMRHACEHGLFPVGEDSFLSILSNNDVENICKYLQEGLPFETIIENVPNMNNLRYPISSIWSIYSRWAWKHISKKYEFSIYKGNRFKFNNNEIIKICEYLEQNLDYKEIIKGLGYDITNMSKETLKEYNHSISTIRLKQTYTEISKDYNFHTERSYQKFNTDEIHEICFYLQSGLDYEKILKRMNVVPNNETELYNYKCVISRIKSRRCFQNISNNYEF